MLRGTDVKIVYQTANRPVELYSDIGRRAEQGYINKSSKRVEKSRSIAPNSCFNYNVDSSWCSLVNSFKHIVTLP